MGKWENGKMGKSTFAPIAIGASADKWENGNNRDNGNNENNGKFLNVFSFLCGVT